MTMQPPPQTVAEEAMNEVTRLRALVGQLEATIRDLNAKLTESGSTVESFNILEYFLEGKWHIPTGIMAAITVGDLKKVYPCRYRCNACGHTTEA